MAHARRLVAEGADVLDLGGASSRPAGREYGPGAELVSVEQELSRVLPVLTALRQELTVPVSIDTTRAEVARAALAAGASIVNDVSCAADGALLDVTASASAGYVLMHSRGSGQVTGESIRYRNVVDEVCDELLAAVNRVVAAGIPREHIWLDPGLGFAKTPEQSIALLAAVARLAELGYPLLVGPSRKAFIAATCTPVGQAPAPPQAREGGTAAAVTIAAMAGASAVRVHDVRAAYQAVRLVAAITAEQRGAP